VLCIEARDDSNLRTFRLMARQFLPRFRSRSDETGPI